MPNRIIKESICTSETLAGCSVGANLLFDRLTTKADDHGCFDARVKIIRCGVFPLMMGKVKESDIEKWLNELQSTDCIRMWTHTNGVKYGLFPNFSDHQTIRSIHKRKTPEPPKSLTLLKTDTSSVDSSCKQVKADECLNHDLNPNPNPNLETHIVEKRILEYLNEKTGKNFRPVKANLEIIACRLAEKYTEEDCRHVIDVKTEQWLNDKKNDRYLQPSTLFRVSKFPGYVNEKKGLNENVESTGNKKLTQIKRLLKEGPGDDPIKLLEAQ